MNNKKIILSYKNVTQYYNGNTIIKNINFNIYDNTNVLILGASGSGKSTLVNLLFENKNYIGNIFLDQQNILKYHQNKTLYFKIQIIKQNFSNFFHPFFTVFDYLYEAWKMKYQNVLNYTDSGFNNWKIIKQKIIFFLKNVNLNQNLLLQKIFSLSLGQKQRLIIAKMLILKPKIVILDETTSALDIFNLFSFLNKLKSFFYNIIIISHNLSVFKNFVDKIIILNNKIIEEIIYTKNIKTILQIKNYKFKSSFAKKLFNLLVYKK